MWHCPSPRRFTLPLFAATIFVSAFLLFQVQPLISKFILPWFGGSPAVWTTCMLFFQVTLFAGYVYAHLVSQYLSPRTQAVGHSLLLLTALWLLPITPDDAWKPTGNELPALRIVALLCMTVGLPYFILSSTGPLLQSWFGRQAPGASPYRLYALSNIGSLLALVSYPFAVEPAWGSPDQAILWSCGFGVFALLCMACAAGLVSTTVFTRSTTDRTNGVTESLMALQAESQADRVADAAPHGDAVSPASSDRGMWLGLAMMPSTMLLATTNQVCMDVATVPFLWILPLTLYLLSFILCFDSDRWYSRTWCMRLLVVSLLLVVRTMLHGSGTSIIAQVAIYLSALFLSCMVCHGELARRKPNTRYLTQFYLLMSAGGAGGGLFVGLLAPYVFPAYWELHLGIVGCVVALAAVIRRDARESAVGFVPTPGMILAALSMPWMMWSLQSHARESVTQAIEVTRNFYGVLRVIDDHGRSDAATGDQPVTGNVDANDRYRPDDPGQRMLYHGSILHGTQFLATNRRHLPTAYYGPTSGSGLALQRHRSDQPRRIGVVGLGIGTLATYGRSTDEMVFYEINPDVERLARAYFTFLADTKAASRVIIGDARLSLEHSEPQEFDLLVLDAFSGDAIPTHLLTREAAELYASHLKPDGLLCVHISNLHFDLRPVLQGVRDELGWHSAGIQSRPNPQAGTSISQWMLLSPVPIPAEITGAADATFGEASTTVVWTDEWSNLLSVLR